MWRRWRAAIPIALAVHCQRIALLCPTSRTRQSLTTGVAAAVDSAHVQEQLSESSFFQGAGGRGHRPELALPAAAILREIDPQARSCTDRPSTSPGLLGSWPCAVSPCRMQSQQPAGLWLMRGQCWGASAPSEPAQPPCRRS